MRNRTREGFAVKKTVWYTVFRQKSLSDSESQIVCEADGDSHHPLQKSLNLIGWDFLFYMRLFFHRGIISSPETADPLVTFGDIPLAGVPS